MNQKYFFRLMGLMAALCTCFTGAPTARAQGSLTPPASPAPTMVSLSQIYAKLDARIAITNSTSAVTISQPGSYYLTTNLTIPPGVAVTITTNDVTLDLNGYTIASSSLSAFGSAILLNTNARNIIIRNGIIQSGVTNKAGTYSGPGFSYGIYGTNLTNIAVSGISVSGVSVDGIFLGVNNSTVVADCVVMTAGAYGIEASTVKNSIASDCGSTAIYSDLATDSRGISTGTGYGLAAATALNCYGASTSGVGLEATSAQNCFGQCLGANAGLNAINAGNCFGQSSSGNGVLANTVLNCDGSSSTGDGIYANYLAQNSYGISGSGNGLYAYYIALACVGASTSGTGLICYIGNSCVGNSSTGTAESVTHAYNMQ